MAWLAATFEKYPELAVFLVVGLGYWVGGFKLRGFGLGPVTGSLIVGVLVGYFFKVPVSSMAKSILFLLFLFSIGYSVGPKFIQAMKGDGARWAALAAFICAVGLATAYGVAKFLNLDVGLAAGLLSGALTESPAIGTATEAIGALALPEAERARLVSHVAVADALCYLFGAFGVIVFCSEIGLRLLGIDLKAEAAKLEVELGIDRSRPGIVSAWRPFEMRAYRLPADSRIAGKTVGEAEGMLPGQRVFIERIRRGGELLDATPDLRLQAGDVVVVSGRREVLVEIIGQAAAEEVEDREALDVPTAAYDVFVTSEAFAGKTLEEVARSSEPVRSVFLRGVSRRGQEIPVGPRTTIERADVLRLIGPEHAVAKVAAMAGEVVRPTDSTDFVALALGILGGALVGIAIIVPVGAMKIAIGTSVGTLIAGLLTGYLHSIRPLFGRIPGSAISFMSAIGLAGFVAMIGLGAGPHFVEALRDSGVGLFFGGMVVTTVPLVAGLYFGRYVLRLNPLLVLGGLAGALTMTAGLAAVQERSGSTVAVLGYSGTVAVGHILLTTWGTVIVWLMAH
ncbi:MAG TPA: aspartate-alanine antiporter [Burkholderiales bacterium]|nr:aspartate-alanine antiporter [Burkholderiales bacterium]